MPSAEGGPWLQRVFEELRKWIKTEIIDKMGSSSSTTINNQTGDSAYYLTQDIALSSGGTASIDTDPFGQVRIVIAAALSAATYIEIPVPTKEEWLDLYVQTYSPLGPGGSLVLRYSGGGTTIKTYSIGGLSSPQGFIDRLVAVYFNGAFVWKINSSNNWNA